MNLPPIKQVHVHTPHIHKLIIMLYCPTRVCACPARERIFTTTTTEEMRAF